MRIRVFFPAVIIVIVICLVDSAILTVTMLDESFRESIFSMCIVWCFAGMLPICMLVWCILTMSNVIEFDEIGVRRIRFGKVMRNFTWEKIQTIGYTDYNSFSGWVYIAEKEKQYDSGMMSITKMRLDREVIYFHMSEKAQKAIQQYAPEKFVDKV